MGVEWANSAGKHSIPHEDALYAIQNAVYTSTDVYTATERPNRTRRVFVGPQHAQTSRLIEVLVEISQGGDFVIYHVMPLGSHYRQQMEEDQ